MTYIYMHIYGIHITLKNVQHFTNRYEQLNTLQLTYISQVSVGSQVFTIYSVAF